MSKYDGYVDDRDYEDDYVDEKEEAVVEDNTIIPLLDLISTWFIRIGIVIGIIVLLYYIVVGKIFSALLFILGLVVSYFFGYFFMFCLDKFTSSN